MSADGVYRLTEHAKKRYRRDMILASGNPGVPPELARQARARLAAGSSTRLRRDPKGKNPGAALYRAWSPDPDGFDAECPECETVNRVEAEELQRQAAKRWLAHPRFAELAAEIMRWRIRLEEEARERRRLHPPPLPPLTEADAARLGTEAFAQEVRQRQRQLAWSKPDDGADDAEEQRLIDLAESFLRAVRIGSPPPA